MPDRVVMLVDNGSRRAAATLSLRAIAASLADVSGRVVHPVSLHHADRVPADRLGGQPAAVFWHFVERQLARGRRDFVAVPLFFGLSRAITSFIPEQVAGLAAIHGPFRLDVAEPLVPLPQGEPRVADILADHVRQAGRALGPGGTRVIVVDHGSPAPDVNAVRRYAVAALGERLPAGMPIDQAVMERREGAAYDFNGELLGDLFDRIGAGHGAGMVRVALAMLFLQPGRHAGAGGDIAQIVAGATARHAGLRVAVSPLVGEHPLLTDILHDRLRAALDG